MLHHAIVAEHSTPDFVMSHDNTATKQHPGRPCKDPAAGPMSDAERGRAYRQRKKLVAAAALNAPKSLAPQMIQERTDAELHEALRQALTDVRRQPSRKAPRQRVALIVAEFHRRYPNE